MSIVAPSLCQGSCFLMCMNNRPVPTWTGGLVCDEPFCEVISVSLHMSVITQYGESALMMAARRWDGTEVVSLLLKAGANTDLQNKVCQCSLRVNVLITTVSVQNVCGVCMYHSCKIHVSHSYV